MIQCTGLRSSVYGGAMQTIQVSRNLLGRGGVSAVAVEFHGRRYVLVPQT
jgi:hypothetical protein